MAETTTPFPRQPVEPAPVEPLWREALGERLRRLRLERGATLTDVARRAGISPQYLSEIERGIKEPSSEMIAAVSGALGESLLDLTAGVVADLRPVQAADDVRPGAYGALALVS